MPTKDEIKSRLIKDLENLEDPLIDKFIKKDDKGIIILNAEHKIGCKYDHHFKNFEIGFRNEFANQFFDYLGENDNLFKTIDRDEIFDIVNNSSTKFYITYENEKFKDLKNLEVYKSIDLTKTFLFKENSIAFNIIDLDFEIKNYNDCLYVQRLTYKFLVKLKKDDIRIIKH